jgi:hypothetical protein
MNFVYYNTNITHLDLSNNTILQDEISNLCEALPMNQNLRILNVANNLLVNNSILKIFACLKENDILEELDISENCHIDRLNLIELLYFNTRLYKINYSCSLHISQNNQINQNIQNNRPRINVNGVNIHMPDPVVERQKKLNEENDLLIKNMLMKREMDHFLK